MTIKERESLRHAIDAEGFDYCFRYYSAWEIDDAKFQALLQAYVAAVGALEDYIESADDARN